MDIKQKLLEETFEKPFSPEQFMRFATEFFGGIKVIMPDKDIKNIPNEYDYTVESYRHMASYSHDNETLDIFAVKLQSGRGRTVERARSMQRSFISSLLKSTGRDASIAAFYTDDDPRWRLSFVRLDYERIGTRIITNLTPAKRYSYLVGEKEPCHTAKEQLFPIFRNDDYKPTLDRIEEAFSVEKVTKDFFDQYKEKYFVLKEHLDGSDVFNAEAARCGFTSEQFAKKLMGQLAFLYFLQKKGWLGISVIPKSRTQKEYDEAYWAKKPASKDVIPKIYIKDVSGFYIRSPEAIAALSDSEADVAAGCFKSDEWGKGEKRFIRHLFTTRKDKNFFDEILAPLFYEALNQHRGNNSFYKRFNCKIPFLNGGLFEPLEGYDWEFTKFAIPNELFSNEEEKGEQNSDGILDIFDRYNFTMNEDEPLEREVAVDPEMLGKIFENLLDAKDRKSKGAFYTPREIVHYMCAESLIHYLVGKTGVPYDDMKIFIVDGEFLKDEDYNNHGQRKLPQSVYDNLKAIDKALKNIKVADPSVGSGAFPLGMLSEIVKVRNNITYYYAAMYEKAEDRARIFEQRDPYTLKWQTIQNSIFAVDIEASAVDIAKLRLWLALVVDEDLAPTYDEIRWGTGAKQKDPRPLPNLDYNIMCGNSLIDEFEGIQLFDDAMLGKDKFGTNEPQASVQLSLFQDSMEIYLDDLRREQERLFGEQNQSTKLEIKSKIDGIIDNIIRAKLERDSNFDGLRKYEESLKQKTKPYFLWKLEFARVFRENGGFDVVIGNPPYGAKLSTTDKNLFKLKYSNVHMRTPDTFNYFISCSFELLSGSGILSFIVPNNLLYQNEYEKARNLLLNTHKFIGVVNIGDNVFESADVPTCVFLAQKGNQAKPYAFGYNDFRYIPVCEIIWNKFQEWLHSETVNKTPSLVLGVTSEASAIFEKVQSSSVLIDDIAHEVASGISTGGDKVFRISKTQIEAMNLEQDIIKPVLIGREIDKYSISWDNYFLIYSTKHSETDSYANIFEYLQPHKEKLSQKRETRKGILPWWCLHWSRYPDLFTGEKIILRQTSDSIRATYDSNNFYVLNSILVLKLDDPQSFHYFFVLAILNSKLNNYIYKNLTQEEGRAFAEVKPKNVRKLYIPRIESQLQHKFVKLSSEIYEQKKSNPSTDTTTLEAEIDRLVYELYGLTEDEIKIVEGLV